MWRQHHINKLQRTAFFSQMATGAPLVLSQILIPTITANLGGITRQTCSSLILLWHGLHQLIEKLLHEGRVQKFSWQWKRGGGGCLTITSPKPLSIRVLSQWRKDDLIYIKLNATHPAENKRDRSLQLSSLQYSTCSQMSQTTNTLYWLNVPRLESQLLQPKHSSFTLKTLLYEAYFSGKVPRC